MRAALAEGDHGGAELGKAGAEGGLPLHQAHRLPVRLGQVRLQCRDVLPHLQVQNIVL